MTITSVGFNPGTIVRFGATSVSGRFDSRDIRYTKMFLETPAHAAGPVDLIIAAPGLQDERIAGAFTYVAPDSFDFNGVWEATSEDGSDRGMRFTIRNSVLVSAACVSVMSEEYPLKLSRAPVVSNGEFAFVGDDGASVSGRMVSPEEAIGTINLAPCTVMKWRTYPR